MNKLTEESKLHRKDDSEQVDIEEILDLPLEVFDKTSLRDLCRENAEEIVSSDQVRRKVDAPDESLIKQAMRILRPDQPEILYREYLRIAEKMGVDVSGISVEQCLLWQC